MSDLKPEHAQQQTFLLFWLFSSEHSNAQLCTQESKAAERTGTSGFSEEARDVGCCSSNTLQFRPPQSITSHTLPPPLPKCSSYNHTSFWKITICFFFSPTFAIPVPGAVWIQVLFSSVTEVGEEWIWLKDYGLNSPNVWYCFDGSQHRKLLFCRWSGFGS